MYISRAVSAGAVWNARGAVYVPMPELSGEARRLYEKVHGAERYRLFQDAEGTIHGGSIRSNEAVGDLEPFTHKPEYDAESVFWSALSAIIRVQPSDDVETDTSMLALADAWEALERHKINEQNPHRRRVMDFREYVFLNHPLPEDYCDLLLPSMEAVGVLLHKIAQQVAPSYPMMAKPPPRADHLHEAMQRHILEYLVEHRDKDIPLDPTRMRPTTG